MKKFVLQIMLLFPVLAAGQIVGTITDMNNEPLPFASIYIKDSSKGTTSNADGKYEFNPPPGNYDLVFQYVGYKQRIVQINFEGKRQELNVQLTTDALDLQEVVVRADAEDPAYAIIRKAIAKRDSFRSQVDQYSCDVYIKGTQKLLDAPEKILGQEIGDLGGSLDSNRQGIIYLSESLARLHFEAPDTKKEVMISSKVSGDDNGFGFNRATLMDFNFYEEHIDIERNLLSPIADNAMSYYRYKLIGTLFDEYGHLINKIQVIPKRKHDPVFGGFIYIVEDVWNIQSTELFATGHNIKQPVLDTLVIKQVHVPTEQHWMLLSQTIDFKFKVFGFKGHGYFTGVFSNYEFGEPFEIQLDKKELFKVEEGANDYELAYWDSLRPVPLTLEERSDYFKKDSLQKIWESKEYLDSMDDKRNKFKPFDLLFGYSYRNSFKKTFISIGSPLTTVQFNTVQGYLADLELRLTKRFDDYGMRWLRLEPTLQYGLADRQLRGSLRFSYRFNRTDYSQINVSGGRVTAQFDPTEPISPTLNTLYSLIGRENYMKLYEKRFGSVQFSRELTNGLFGWAALEYGERLPLFNQSDHSLFNEDKVYTANNPLISLQEGEPFRQHRALVASLSFRIRFGQTFMTYPGRKYIMESKYPELVILWKHAFGVNSDFADFSQLKFRINDELQLGLFGSTDYRLEAGTFLRDEQVFFPDFFHFSGNQTFVGNPERYIRSFQRLPYYEFSTTQSYFKAHFQHHFDGFILDRIPLMRRLNWKSVLGGNFLTHDGLENYWELSYGIENIGFKALRLFRLDYVASFRGGEYLGSGFMIGLNL